MTVNRIAGIPASGSWSFGCFVAVEPTQVWVALTQANRTRTYLYGLSAHSTWRAGAAIDFRFQGAQVLIGQVLCIEFERRLSYVVRAGANDLPVYLTWLIRSSPGGSAVRLQIDEIEHPDDDEGAEDVWLPVLAAFQRCFDAPSEPA